MDGSVVDQEKKNTFGQIVRKIISGILTALLCLTIIISLTVTWKKLQGAEPDFLGFRTFYIATGSMEPTIPAGAAVLTRKAPGGKYEVNDVITFTSYDLAIYGEPNTHRIIGYQDTENGRVYMTKGDNNPVADELTVSEKDVLGRVIFSTGKVTFFGTLVGAVTTPMGYITIIVLPILAVFALSLRDFAKSVKEVQAAEKTEDGAVKTDNSWMYDANSPVMQELLRREQEAKEKAENTQKEAQNE